VLGDEALLVERAVSAILKSVQQAAGTEGVPVDRLRAGDVSTNELAELLSPSLFAEERVVILESADEAGKDAVALIASAAADLPSGMAMVVLHSGGGRAKALAGQLQKIGAQTHEAAKITKPRERADFVRAEFRAHKVKVDEETVTALLETVGSDIRELAATCSQLVADTAGQVNAAAVRRYHSGNAEVTGFDIADKAVAGDVAGSTEALRWAMARGVPHVLLADALAEAVHAIARIGPLSGYPKQLAGEVGMPYWRVEKVQKQARRWSRDKIPAAVQLVAALNADVKGAAADPDYALENTVRKIAELAAQR
jgi:DNA polymerase-3 subunit delta